MASEKCSKTELEKKENKPSIWPQVCLTQYSQKEKIKFSPGVNQLLGVNQRLRVTPKHVFFLLFFAISYLFSFYFSFETEKDE